MTLYGPSSARVTNICARWLSPTPVRPATTAGIQPPLGVTDTTHPASSADTIEVVSRENCAPNPPVWRAPADPPAAGRGLGAGVGSGFGPTVQRARRSRNGFVPPWCG